jgi:DNA mismatch repair protein MutL
MSLSKITVLDQNTINQIAAGEVVERPAAVVKEMVENAIDAGANAITVEIKEGGISFIRITDNGSGIEEDDMPLLFLRHSTSKIKSAEDLLSVSSLGFRGEALSSIAAISQVELVTKTSNSFTGIRYVIAGGEEKSLEHIGCPNGTTFIIRNLFFNTPARKKFLKSAVTEAGYISDIMERLSVSHPNISFKFINNTQIKLHTTGNNNLKDILYNVYGREINPQLVEVKGSNDQVNIAGFVAKPVVSRGNRNYENYFINGRYIKSTLINKAIEEAYRPYIMAHRYPFTSLHIQINSELIDVNVHPAKLEIRFKNSEELYRLIYHSVKSALEGRELIPAVVLTEEKEKRKTIHNVPEPFEVKRREEGNYNKQAWHGKENLNKDGFNKENFNKEGFNKGNIDKENLNKEGFNKEDIDKEDIDKENLNKEGFNKQNYNKENFSEVIKNRDIYNNDSRSNFSTNSTNKNNTTNVERYSKMNHYGENIRNYNNLTEKEKELIKETEIGKLHTVINSASDLVKENNSYSSHNTENIIPESIARTDDDTESSVDQGQLDAKQNQSMCNEVDNSEITNNNLIMDENTANAQMHYDSTIVDKPEQLSFLSEESIKSHRIVGQVFSTYWIVEFGDKMFLIDQHAAHEKVLYESTMKSLKEKEQHPSQLIEPPLILSLSIREVDALKKHMDVLNKLGFEIEEFGGKEYAVRAVPSDLYGLAQQEILIELIDGLVDELYNDTPEMILEKIASMSCKAAVKGNHRLSSEEANTLIEQLLTLENPYHCPHGRPTIVSMSKYEIEKKFKRIV